MAVQVSKRYVLGDLLLEPDKRVLRRADTEIHLAHRPFQVLLYLVEHRDRVVTRRELLDQFWEGHDVYEVALSKCVGAVRKALDDRTDNPRHIETRWAEGYRYIGRVEEQFPASEPSILEIEKTRGVRIVIEEDESNGLSDSEEIISIEAPGETLRLPAPKRSRTVAIAFGLSAIALTASALIFFRLRTQPAHQVAEAAPIRSLAVLPLKNLTDDPANDYFSDGITESLIDSLSNVNGLKVISRGSVFRFRGREIDPREVGQQLGVAAVLEGSVRRDENSVRVAVRLVSAEDGRVLWASETNERNLRDIFALQDEIARQVATAMRFRLSGEVAQQLTRRYTDNVEAYQLYLKGRFFWNKRTEAGLRKGIEYFDQAIKIDPNYALAYAGIADSYALLDLYGELKTTDYFSQAKKAAHKALDLDNTLAEAHTSLAYVKYYYDWEWSGAEQEFKRAIELNPNYATAHQWYAEYLFYMKRFDESLAEINRAHELDPLSLVINTELGSPYFYMRQYDQAMEKYRKALEMEPHFPLATYSLALCYEQKSMFDEAITMLGGGKYPSATLASIYAASGRRQEAKQMLHGIIKNPKPPYSFSPYLVARVYTVLGDKDQAFAWLEKAHEVRDERMVMLKVDQDLDSLRADTRFADLMRRVGLPK
jgi:TolB-like protein/DNA-binding winged helix-turn-helix (wHTH) protein/Tfp pilus assembly protein PilF